MMSSYDFGHCFHVLKDLTALACHALITSVHAHAKFTERLSILMADIAPCFVSSVFKLSPTIRGFSYCFSHVSPVGHVPSMCFWNHLVSRTALGTHVTVKPMFSQSIAVDWMPGLCAAQVGNSVAAFNLWQGLIKACWN